MSDVSEEFELEMRLLRGEFPTAEPDALLRIRHDRQFEKDLREAHGRKLRGPTNRVVWFDEAVPAFPLVSPQAAPRINRGPLPDGVAFFDIEIESADDQLTAMLDRKGTFFEEFVGEVKVGVQKSPAELWEESADMTFWPPPLKGTAVRGRSPRPKYPIMSKAQAAKWEEENNG